MSPERALARTSIRCPIGPLVNALLGVLALITGLSAQPAQDRQHGETPAAFKFVRGKGVPVCEAYKKFLDAVPDRAGRGGPKDQDRLMCMRQIPAEFAALSQPQWTEINPLEHMDLATQVGAGMNFVWEESVRSGMLRELRATKDEIRVNYESAHDKWYLAEADIDNDGRPELLVKFRRGHCNPDSPDVDHYRIPIIVFDASSKTLDARKTRQLLNQKEDRSFALLAQYFDVFRFQEKVYVDGKMRVNTKAGVLMIKRSQSIFMRARAVRWYAGIDFASPDR